MYSFLLVFLDSVSSSWPVFVLLYLSFCVNKGQAACSAWHGSQLCVRRGRNGDGALERIGMGDVGI